MSAEPCPWCDGRCKGADLTPLLVPQLAWLWQAVAAAADRRGDPDLTTGTAITLTLPLAAAERAAVAGLVAGDRPGRRTRLRLEQLTELVRRHSAALTPGAVAAHSVSRRVGQRTALRAAREARHDRLREVLRTACAESPELNGRQDLLFEQLRRTGWIARLDSDGEPGEAESVLSQAVAVVRRVLRIAPDERCDRRLLVPSDPHALDDGSRLGGLCLAMLGTLGLVATTGVSARAQWSQVGVDCDDIVGGLSLLGLAPLHWQVPPQAIVTVPPRELAECRWPAPPDDHCWVFVTENPSVLAGAARLAAEPGAGPVRLVCTMGTPSAIEIAALARLASSGWRVAVRADFDPAGLRHVQAVLAGVAGASPWRMGVADYRASSPSVANSEPIPATPWDADLPAAMTATGTVAFEEALLPTLLMDLRCGHPG